MFSVLTFKSNILEKYSYAIQFRDNYHNDGNPASYHTKNIVTIVIIQTNCG